MAIMNPPSHLCRHQQKWPQRSPLIVWNISFASETSGGWGKLLTEDL